MLLKSSNLMDAKYDPQAQRLTILFKNATTYEIEPVPADKWQGLKAAPSPGGYFAAEIKGKYREKKVDTLCASCKAAILKGHEFCFEDANVAGVNGNWQERRAVHKACRSGRKEAP